MSLESDLVTVGFWEAPAKLIAAAIAAGGGAGLVSSGFGEPDVPPVLTDFSWTNQSGATAVQRPGYISLLTTDRPAGDTLRLLTRPAPAAPYTATMRMRGVTSVNYSGFGMAALDSVSGHILAVGCTGSSFHVARWSSPTAFIDAAVSGQSLNPEWFRIRDDGVNLYADISADGYSFSNIWSAARASYLTNAPDHIGFYLHNVGAQGQASVFSWDVQ